MNTRKKLCQALCTELGLKYNDNLTPYDLRLYYASRMRQIHPLYNPTLLNVIKAKHIRLKYLYDSYLKAIQEEEKKQSVPIVEPVKPTDKKNALNQSPFNIEAKPTEQADQTTEYQIEIDDESLNTPTLSIIKTPGKDNKKQHIAITIRFNKKLDKNDQPGSLLNPFIKHPIFSLKEKAFNHDKNKDAYVIKTSAEMLKFLQLLRCEKPDLFEGRINRLVHLENQLKKDVTCKHIKLYEKLKEKIVPQLIDLGNKIITKAALRFSLFNNDRNTTILRIKNSIRSLKSNDFKFQIKTFTTLTKTKKENSFPEIKDINSLDKRFLTKLKMEILEVDPLNTNPLNSL